MNNATYEAPANFRTLDKSILDKHYQVNNSGTLLLTMEFARGYERAFPGCNHGRIINMVSKGPDPNNLAYIASKGMLIAITEPLSIGLAPVGITVNSIDPGPTDSGWINQKSFAPHVSKRPYRRTRRRCKTDQLPSKRRIWMDHRTINQIRRRFYRQVKRDGPPY